MKRRTPTEKAVNRQSTPKKPEIEIRGVANFFSSDGSMKTDGTSQHECFVREASMVPSGQQPNDSKFDCEEYLERLKEKLHNFKPVDSESIQTDETSIPGPSN